jgi:hypothetical protein
MYEADKQELLTILDAGRDAFLAAVSNVTEDVARLSPGPGRWSVLECAEHVALAEQHMLLQLQNATLSPEPVINTAREAAIKRRAGVRTTRVEAPDAAKPIGRFHSLSKAIEHFLTLRRRTVELVQSAEDLRALSTTHPVIGPVNGYEMLLMMALHLQRHALQIREIRDMQESR